MKPTALEKKLQDLNIRLEASNARLVVAIVLLADIVDAILPSVVTDEVALTRLREASHAARIAALLPT